MVGVQDQRYIQSALSGLRRSLPIEQQQEIGGVRKRAVRLDNILPFAQPVIRRYQHRDLRSQPNGFADVGVVIVIFLFGIIKAERRNRCP